MFTIDKTLTITPLPVSAAPPTIEGKAVGWDWQFESRADLGLIIQHNPGAWAVKLWNQLADREPQAARILTPKFRNRSTAVERIWNRLAELYPDALLPGDMPKAKGRHDTSGKSAQAKKAPLRHAPAKTKRAAQLAKNGAGRQSAWATELTAALRKRFKPGDDFGLDAIYRLVPQFQRRHKANHHVAARLRTTLAQDLRGAGVVKSLKKGRYRMMAAK